jgi:hypothetical protein
MVDIGASSGFSAPVVPALASFKLLLKNRNKQFDAFARQAKVLKDIAYFKEKIAKVETPADIVKDRRLLMFVTSAFGLEGEEKFGGRIRKVLESDLKDPNSFANRTIDPRYKELAAAFKFKEFGTFFLKQNLFVNDIANRYIRNEFEKSLGDKNPALREAEYFLRTIGGVQDTYQILGDKVLRSIVTTALGLPANIAVQSIEKQKALIDAKLDIKKFQTGAAAATAGTTRPKTALELAKEELASITDARAVVQGSQDTLTSVLDRIQDIQDEYARLAVIQSGTGPYAAEIPVQQTAAPELLRQQGLLASAQEALGRVATNTARMSELMQLAGNPETDAGELADYKTEFATLKTEIENAIAGATYAFDAAGVGASFSTQNLLGGALTDISVQIKSTGETTVVRAHDLSATSAFQTALDTANSAFQAITGSGDSANITAASSALSSAKSTSDTVKLTVDVDANLFAEQIGSVSQWAGTFNTAGTYGGAEALRDAGARLIDIDGLLSEIRNVASESALRDVGADRSDLTAKYTDLLAELSTAITTSDAGANLLNGGNQDFQVIGDSYARARGRDLLALIHSPLSGGDVGSVAAANAVVAQIDGSITTTLETASREIGVDAKTFGLAADTLDPRAGIDSMYAKLSADMEGLVAKAAIGGKNLLDPDQSSIKLVLGAAGQNITIDAKTAFETDVADLLNSGALLLPSDALDSTTALAKLETVRFNAARILSDLNNDARKLDSARTVTGTRIKDLEDKAAASGSANKLNANEFAIKFIEKYLTLKDSENAAAMGGFSSGNAYLTQLIQPIKIRGGGLDFNT